VTAQPETVLVAEQKPALLSAASGLASNYRPPSEAA
jgi:hypothetical protein